jgi:hypothetical protein
MDIAILLVVVGSIVALVRLFARARAENEAVITARLARFAGPNHDL